MKSMICTIIKSMLMLSCGDTTFSQKPRRLQSRSLEAGEAGAQFGFKQLVSKAENVKVDDAGDVFAKIILESRFQLMKIIETSESLSKSGERGHFVALSGFKEVSEDYLSDNLELSDKRKIIYSRNNSMKATECQVFFHNEITAVFHSEFFDIHTSFFSLSF